jgi:hypothetical protein
MKQFLRLLLMPGILVWLLGGCSEKIEPKPATYSQLLTGTEKKVWKMVSIQLIDDGRPSSVIPVSQLNDCSTDDVLTFYADAERKLEVSQGSAICYPAEPDLYVTDDWTLVNATASLTFYIPYFDGKFIATIKNLTANVLTVELYFGDINASYRVTFNSTTTK